MEASPWRWMSEVERQVTSLSGQCQSRDEKLRELTASLQKLQVQVDQMDDGGAGVSSLVTSVVGQHLKDLGASGLLGSQVRHFPLGPWSGGHRVGLALLFLWGLRELAQCAEGGLAALS